MLWLSDDDEDDDDDISSSHQPERIEETDGLLTVHPPANI